MDEMVHSRGKTKSSKSLPKFECEIDLSCNALTTINLPDSKASTWGFQLLVSDDLSTQFFYLL
jgi:hypothetical protein